jgi:hypothetical protein
MEDLNGERFKGVSSMAHVGLWNGHGYGFSNVELA